MFAAALTWTFALLLGIAGVAKIGAPAATAGALHGAKLPSDARLVRGLGVAEIALAALALTVGGWAPATLLAVAYAAFAAFAHRQSQRGEGCGCFGQTDAPATPLHVVVDVLAAVTAATAAVVGAPPPWTVLSDDPFQLIAVGALVVLAAALLRLVLSALPELTAALALHTDEAAS